jgi:signal transduction histidine kinase
LNDLISEIFLDTQPISLTQEIAFKKNIATSVYADKERIRQVIGNFICNAIKYASDSKKIIVSLERQEDKVVCSVQDMGKGICLEEQDKIFERFYQVLDSI